MNDRFLAFAEALDAYTRKSKEVISRLDKSHPAIRKPT